VVELFKTDQNSVKKEALWVLANGMTSTSTDQIDYFISEGVIDVFVGILEERSDHKMTLLAMESIEKLLVLSKLNTSEPNEYYVSIINEKQSKCIQLNSSVFN
jgi:hypothetical protein